MSESSVEVLKRGVLGPAKNAATGSPLAAVPDYSQSLRRQHSCHPLLPHSFETLESRLRSICLKEEGGFFKNIYFILFIGKNNTEI